MTRKIHVHVSGPQGEGKSTIATIIRKALNEAGISNSADETVANNNIRDALSAPHGDVTVTISEGIQKEGSVRSAHKEQHGS